MPKYKCEVGFKGSLTLKMKVAFAEWGFSKFKKLNEDQIFHKKTLRERSIWGGVQQIKANHSIKLGRYRNLYKQHINLEHNTYSK